MTTKRVLIPALAAFLAVTAPSAFADRGECGGHGRDDDRWARFDDDDRDDDDREGRRRVFVRRDDDDDDDDNDRDARRRVIIRRDDDDRRVFRRVNMRFRGLDRNRDGIITRREWRGNDRSFRVHDRNRDGILSGSEVWTGSHRRSPRG